MPWAQTLLLGKEYIQFKYLIKIANIGIYPWWSRAFITPCLSVINMISSVPHSEGKVKNRYFFFQQLMFSFTICVQLKWCTLTKQLNTFNYCRVYTRVIQISTQLCFLMTCETYVRVLAQQENFEKIHTTSSQGLPEFPASKRTKVYYEFFFLFFFFIVEHHSVFFI